MIHWHRDHDEFVARFDDADSFVDFPPEEIRAASE
jgi:hypothetical protein